ncbi:MAG: SDR family NAD(P)-dependent oxidoreductase, partial [Steroidobacteraceae bacterium]
MGSRFDGKVALITGGSRGLGRSAALAFAREGARVAVSTGSDVRGGEETVSLIKAAGGDAFFAKCDISNESDVERFVAATVER